MKQNPKVTVILGCGFWAAALGAAWFTSQWARQEQSTWAPQAVAEYYLSPTDQITLSSVSSVGLAAGDPIFHEDEDGWVQVGHVSSVDSQAERLVSAWYSDAPVSEFDFNYHQSDGSLAEAVRTLLPADRREAIKQKIAKVSREYGPELTDAFRPIIERTLRESVPIIRDAIIASTEKRREELEAIGKRYEKTIVNERVVPLAQKEVLPIVRAHGEPLASEIGQALWQRASVFRFGWRIVYDKSPLVPKRDLTKQEWDRFVKQEAIPVFESRVEDIVEVIKEILRDLAKNEKVRSEISHVIEELLGDGQLRSLVANILNEAIAENSELRQTWTAVWQTDEARAAIGLANDRLEPIVREIGDEIFGTRETGISPGFARVLRSQILRKDRRWIVATRRTEPRQPGQPAKVEPSSRGAAYPLMFFAGRDDPI